MLTKVGGHEAVVVCGDGQLDLAVRARGGVGRREAAGVPNAVDDDLELHELAGLVASPLTGRTNGEADGARRGTLDTGDLAAQIAPGDHRIEQLEVAVDRMRRQRCLHDRTDQTAPPAGLGAGAGAGLVLGCADAHGLGSVRSVSVYMCTPASVTQRDGRSSSVR